MFDSLERLVARPFISWWLNTSTESWRRLVVANDSPHVHSRGTNPDRVLVAGDGAATGRGVITHDLGLPGYLARSLTEHTGRATDVDIVVRSAMTARTCLPALEDVDLDRYDIVVVSLGVNEALALTPLASWQDALSALLRDLLTRTPEATHIFLLPIPFIGVNPHFPSRLARIVDKHVRRLNASTAKIARELPRVDVVPVDQSGVYEIEGKHVYKRWAEGIALRISVVLDPARVQIGSTDADDELGRQRALVELEALGGEGDPVLDGLAEQARQMFGTPMAAVTLIQSDVQVMRAAVGLEPVVLPRAEAFCDITIRRDSHFVVEDAALDSRFADYGVVTGALGVRFYAGYPIESPDGQRVGALCIMDTSPRSFTLDDAELLRSLAQTVQTHLWQKSTT